MLWERWLAGRRNAAELCRELVRQVLRGPTTWSGVASANGDMILLSLALSLSRRNHRCDAHQVVVLRGCSRTTWRSFLLANQHGS